VKKKLSLYNESFQQFLIDNDMIDNYIISLMRDLIDFRKYLKETDASFALDNLKQHPLVNKMRIIYKLAIENTSTSIEKILQDILNLGKQR
jgi:hypothetical protein